MLTWQIWQTDHNEDNRILLIAIYVFSKLLWVQHIPNKVMEVWIFKAFERIIQQTTRIPRTLRTDNGTDLRICG